MQVVLTFDDGLDSHYSRVGPLLKSHGFNASFFVTPKDVWSKIRDDIRLLHEEELISLYKDGFDIGNHTFDHINLIKTSSEKIWQNIIKLNKWLADFGIPRPVTFSYPSFYSSKKAANIVKKLGFKVARTGFADEPQKIWHGVPALRPKKYFKKGDDPFRVFTTAVLNNKYSMDWFKQDLDERPEDGVMVMTGHGVNTDSVWKLLQDMVQFLADNGGEFVSLRHIEREFSEDQVTTETKAL